MMVVSRVAGELLRSLVAGIFGAAGTVVGAVYGLMSAAFVGQDDDGFVRGTLVGAIAGALVSVDLAQSLLAIWCCSSSVDRRIKRTLSAISALPTLADPHSGRGDRVLFDRWTSFGFTPPAVAVVVVTKQPAGQGACPICLQEFEAGGESAARLPACSHVFHMGCIRRWLLCKSHCPMCRHAVC
jgi:hypothetical protein